MLHTYVTIEHHAAQHETSIVAPPLGHGTVGARATPRNIIADEVRVYAKLPHFRKLNDPDDPVLWLDIEALVAILLQPARPPNGSAAGNRE